MQSKNSVKISDVYWSQPSATLRQKSNTFLIISKKKSNLNNIKTKKQVPLANNYCWPSLLEPGISLPTSLNIIPKQTELSNKGFKVDSEGASANETSEWIIEGLSGKKNFDISKIDNKGALWIRFANLSTEGQYHILTPISNSPTNKKAGLEHHDDNVKSSKTSIHLMSKGLSKNGINSILKNHLLGAWVGFLIHLDLVGVGYRVLMKRKNLSDSQIEGHKPLPKAGKYVYGIKTSAKSLAIDSNNSLVEPKPTVDSCIQYTELILKVGYSHDLNYRLATDIGAFSKKPAHICLYGPNLLRLAQTIAEIRAFKKPDPYKGKGFRYRGENIKLKIGKKK
jgi:ribosomal protein L6P/L9E